MWPLGGSRAWQRLKNSGDQVKCLHFAQSPRRARKAGCGVYSGIQKNGVTEWKDTEMFEWQEEQNPWINCGRIK